jgi:hypothetical protein
MNISRMTKVDFFVFVFCSLMFDKQRSMIMWLCLSIEYDCLFVCSRCVHSIVVDDERIEWETECRLCSFVDRTLVSSHSTKDKLLVYSIDLVRMNIPIEQIITLNTSRLLSYAKEIYSFDNKRKNKSKLHTSTSIEFNLKWSIRVSFSTCTDRQICQAYLQWKSSTSVFWEIIHVQFD